MNKASLPAQAPARRSRLKVFFMALGGGVLFVFLALSSQAVFLIEAPIRLFLGWAFHLYKTVPPLLPQWAGLTLPLVCLLLTAVLIHRFLRWWSRAKGGERTWRFAYSSALLGLILLGSAAAIAISGIVHQLVWLPQREMIVNTGKMTDRTAMRSQTYQLLRTIEDFIETEGRYPGSLKEIKEAYGPRVPEAWISTKSWRAPEPFLLIQPGAPPFPRSESPVRLISPQLNDQVIVGFEDGGAVIYPARLVDKWLESYMRTPTPASSANE